MRALQSVEGKVSMLAKFETFHENPGFLTQQLANVKALKVGDIKRVFEQYVANKANVVLSIIPKGKPELIAQQDNYTPKFYEPKTTEEVRGEVQLPSITDSFDRSIKPQAGVAKAITLPDLWQVKTDNGIDVLGAFDTETPTTTLLLQIPAGRLYDPENKAGVALLTVEMLGQATTQSTPSELAQQLAKLGAEIAFEAKSEYIEIKLSTLSKNLTATLDILSEKLLQPKFSESDFARVKSMVSEYSKSERDSAKFLADSALSQVMYQEGNYSKPWLPSQAELATTELADVKSFYAQQIRPQGSKLSIVSDVAQSKLMSALTGALSQWQGKGELDMALPKLAALDSNTVYLVHKENAPQVQIRVARHAAAEDLAAEHFKSQIMNFAFSGSFNSRVNQNLRESKGYTYGIGGRFSGYGDAGQFVLASGINAANVADALTEIQQEFSKINEYGLTDEEIQFTRNSIAQRDALKYETPAAKLNFFAMMHAHNVDADIVDVRAKIIETVGKKELNQLANKYFTPAEMTYVVVGDANTLSKQLEGKGFTVKQLTIQ
ncbi:M16 family metallopeptidase [Pseudoalteromonas piscicida]